MIYAFDYETYYSKTYSIATLGNWGYTHHPEFDAYLLSVEGQDGYTYCGNPKDFDWKLLQGATVIAHNAGFEEAVTDRLKELGIVPADLQFGELVDTADLAAYLGYPRNLAGASEGLLGIKPDKTMRDKAKGKHWNDMLPEFQASMKKYAAADAHLELRLWLEHSHKWPAWEKELSELTREMCRAGVPVDKESVEESIKKLDVALWKIRTIIPWGVEEKTPTLSKLKVAEECRKHGVPPPKSMAKDSEEFEEWLKQNGDQFPWAEAMGQYRRVNALQKKLITMRDRTRDDGIMPYGLKYGGAHTLRDSGDSGWNPQNLARDPFFFDSKGLITNEKQLETLKFLWKKDELPANVKFFVDVRGKITAPEGKVFGIVDLAAIEPCCLAVLSEDNELVEALRGGMAMYEAWARITGRYDGSEPLKQANPDLHYHMKTEVLGLGYGAGPAKAIVIAKTLAGLDLTLDQASMMVNQFRARKFIPNLWKKLEEGMSLSIGDDFEMELPSGRSMKYRAVRQIGGLSAEIPRLGKMMRLGWWGGSLTENLIQAAARDVFMDRVLALKYEKLSPILRVHDEVVSLLDKETAEQDLQRMIKVMSTPPEWFPELPIRAEGKLCAKYTK